MAQSRAYLDHNASAPLRDVARAAVIDTLGLANPSSVHAEGRAARRVIENARRDVAALVNGKPEHVVFTSGATEAAATLLTPNWQMGRSALRFSHLYVCAADHPCTLNGGRFDAEQVTRLPVSGDGLLDLDALRVALASHDKNAGLPLVAVHLANNETGVIQRLEEISAIVKSAGGVLVVDAVQAAGRIPVDISEGLIDYLILSAHKIGGPKGVGAIVSASDLMMPKPLIGGGGQEKGHRSGTENLAGIAGFGAAAREAVSEMPRMNEVEACRNELEEFLRASGGGIEIFGTAARRLPNTTFFAFADIKAETAQISYDLAGVALSAGSACSSGKVGPSHVLKAMGYGDGSGALRVSIGLSTAEAEIAQFMDATTAMLQRRSVQHRAA